MPDVTPNDEQVRAAREWLDGFTGIWIDETQSVSVRRLVTPNEVATLLATREAGRQHWSWQAGYAAKRDEHEAREAALSAQVAALREALDDEFPADVGTGYRAHTPKAISAVLTDTAAAAAAHDERVRADERERCARVAEQAWYPRDEWRYGVGWFVVANDIVSDIIKAIRAAGAEGRMG